MKVSALNYYTGMLNEASDLNYYTYPEWPHRQCVGLAF